MACHINRKTHHAPSVGALASADIVTYRYDGVLVYVPAASNYMQALSHARDAFPQLKHLRDASLSLSLSLATPPSSRTGGGGGRAPTYVGISAPAWPSLVARLSRYQIIDVHATPQPAEHASVVAAPSPGAGPLPTIVITGADMAADPVPPYSARSVSGVAIEDKKEALPCPPAPKRNWFFQKLR